MRKEELEKKIKTMKNEIELLEYKLSTEFKNYETVIILAEDVTYKDYINIKNKTKEIMQEVSSVEELGIKNLAYEIKKNKKGIYLIFHWVGNEEIVTEIERYFRIDDDIIKFLTVRVEDNEEEEEEEEE